MSSITPAPPMMLDIADYISDLEKRASRLGKVKVTNDLHENSVATTISLYEVVISDLNRIKNKHKKGL